MLIFLWMRILHTAVLLLSVAQESILHCGWCISPAFQGGVRQLHVALHL